MSYNITADVTIALIQPLSWSSMKWLRTIVASESQDERPLIKWDDDDDMYDDIYDNMYDDDDMHDDDDDTYDDDMHYDIYDKWDV